MTKETLKNGNNYTKNKTIYIWHSSDKSCEKCQALNNKKFSSIDEIPDLPHPNCRCWVETIENKEDDNDVCACWNKIEELLDKAQEIDGDCNSLNDELIAYKNDIDAEILNFKEKENELENLIARTGEITGAASFIDNYPSKSYSQLYQTGYEAIDFIEAGFKVYDTFKSNLEESILEAGKRDKYYHSKANCESAELGAIEAMFTVVFSLGKELYDIILKVGFKHQDFLKVVKDCWQDLEADFMGIKKAKEAGECKIKVLEVEEYFKK